MVKTIRISLDEVEHAEFLAIKGSRTWYDVLLKGIEVLKEAKTK